MRKKLFWGILFVVLCLCILAMLFYNGTLQINNPSRQSYPVRGVDVSAYQGEIDWQVLAGEDIQFAYLKATEGSSYEDPFFQQNLSGALQTGLQIGAYHFFSFDSAGAAQPERFQQSVPVIVGMLPPVIDVEFYFEYSEKTLDAAKIMEIRQNLMEMLIAVESHYGVKPILYVTRKSHTLLIDEQFSGYPIWIRSVYGGIDDWQGECLIWQYSNRKKLDGYKGEEDFIDMNAFVGTFEELEQMQRVKE